MEMYEIILQLSNKNRTYRAITPQGCIAHETAGNNDTDEGNAAYFNNNDLGNVLAHAFCDYNSIRQVAPWNERCNHCAAAPNGTHIGVELCHVNNDPVRFAETYKRGVYTFAYLMTQVIKPCITVVTKENLMSHHEVTIKYNVVGGHTDPTSYFAKYGKTMDMLRADVQVKINEMLAFFKGIQTKLNKCGFNLVVDGVFGDMSYAALKEFQTRSKIPVTGKIDATTIAALDKATVVIETPKVEEIPGPKLVLLGKNVPGVMNYNGKMYAPVRAIGDALGKTTTWDGTTQTATIK